MPVTMASRFCTLSGVLLTGAASPEPAERASGKWFPMFNPLYVSMTRLVVALRVPGWRRRHRRRPMLGQSWPPWTGGTTWGATATHRLAIRPCRTCSRSSWFVCPTAFLAGVTFCSVYLMLVCYKPLAHCTATCTARRASRTTRFFATQTMWGITFESCV